LKLAVLIRGLLFLSGTFEGHKQCLALPVASCHALTGAFCHRRLRAVVWPSSKLEAAALV
jgi:hypothetical protein